MVLRDRVCRGCRCCGAEVTLPVGRLIARLTGCAAPEFTSGLVRLRRHDTSPHGRTYLNMFIPVLTKLVARSRRPVLPVTGMTSPGREWPTRPCCTPGDNPLCRTRSPRISVLFVASPYIAPLSLAPLLDTFRPLSLKYESKQMIHFLGGRFVLLGDRNDPGPPDCPTRAGSGCCSQMFHALS